MKSAAGEHRWLKRWLVAVLVVASARSALAQADNEVVAQIGEHVIHANELDASWEVLDPISFARIRNQVYRERRRILDKLIGDHLLQTEAKKRSLTEEELLVREVYKTVTPPTERDIREFYQQNRAAIPEEVSFDEVKLSMSKYMEGQRLKAARVEHLKHLWNAYGQTARMSFQPLRETISNNVDSPALGPAAAPVEIVEFGDFQCPYCKQVAHVVKQLANKYDGRIRFVWRDYPLPAHPDAGPAAEAALCANDQKAFWRYHDLLFQHQQALKIPDLQKYAEIAELNVDAFASCLDSGRFRSHVLDDIAEGTRHRVSGTPAIFINGRQVIGAGSFELYERVILEELEPGSWRPEP